MRVDLKFVIDGGVWLINEGVAGLVDCVNPCDTAKFHYNVKAGAYNLATAALGYEILSALWTKKASGKSLVILTVCMLFARKVIDESMSIVKTRQAAGYLIKENVFTFNGYTVLKNFV